MVWGWLDWFNWEQDGVGFCEQVVVYLGELLVFQGLHHSLHLLCGIPAINCDYMLTES